jgi:hypothetical protein
VCQTRNVTHGGRSRRVSCAAPIVLRTA